MRQRFRTAQPARCGNERLLQIAGEFMEADAEGACQGLRYVHWGILVVYIRPVLCAGLKLTDRYADSPRGERYSLRNVMVAAPRWAERAV